MAERRPLVIVGNNVSELPSGDAVSASLIANTPAGNISATDVQAAINELDGDFVTLYTRLGQYSHQYDTLMATTLNHANSGYITLMSH